MVLRAWYDPDDDNEPIIVGSAQDLDALLDRLAVDGALVDVPPLMQLSRRDAEGWAVLHIGVNGDRGVLTHTDGTGSYVTTDRTDATATTITYDYMGHLREVPGNAEIPLPEVREAAREFVSTNGARPTRVHWRAEE
ncbi:Imm1 family immunity protein [Allokutzneria multivorans]